MDSTFEIINVQTCLPAYSWDEGNPLDINAANIRIEPSADNEEGVRYVGYAPCVAVILSSDPGLGNNARKKIERIVNYGDYYNSESNIEKDTSYDSVYFSHVYVMPGTYTIDLVQTEYIQIIVPDSMLVFGRCFQKYCVDWSWKNFNTTLNNNDPALSDFKWKFAKRGQKYQKLWKWEPCSDSWATGNGVYVQKTSLTDENEVSWQWYNYMSSSEKNPLNTATPWISTGFQQPNQLDWNQTSGPCLNTVYENNDILWQWNYITANTQISRFAEDLTWDQARLQEPTSVTWDFVSNACYGNTTAFMLSTSKITKTKKAVIKVVEIPPTAYLKVTDPKNAFEDVKSNVSPLTVRLTPRFTTAGSFPIERIDWDLGDGSPIITQRRWSPTLEAPFVFSGQIEADYQDPRNYDVIHTYNRTPNTDFSFYPSITAYASSTGTQDSVACMVGPLQYSDPSNADFVLLQTELTDHGKVLIGQINQDTVVWKADK